MAEPITFNSATAKFALPFLHVAQTQKEVFVNEAHVIMDAMLHPLVEGVSDQPPVSPANGECWIVAPGATASFDNRDHQIACFNEGQWIFCQPVEGMRVFDKALGANRFYRDGWNANTVISKPSGGTTVDAEARSAIDGLIDALQRSGIVGS
ncbi:DUF2793 domain-containing protein [Croceicoccus gelatinilyticus]|uniref:DUF2793 domain-containing protein n=1 Tax=Croceicoccus gelatinilyticus TaxID=2835536 RepID=UPI001BCFEC4B|nr:DUF2793 domain-containing protein [Croceicoccus gelatinilyticus]MBS7668212.1 DUF2793 domain-containing protein [Croceicoccus gelatinilyticus]